MKLILIAGAAVAAASIASAQPACPPADVTVAAAPDGAAANVYDDARDTAAIVYADHVARAERHSSVGEIYRWQMVKYAWPRGDYDAIYGPGAYRQNSELRPYPDYPY
ncbi:MAG TPA: hypothetical protein VG166_04265 [Caulobacteraceae bacterium]|jgi:hypothetical protein|nr:hypothetical protein [Caulobacteraceae bacterium]